MKKSLQKELNIKPPKTTLEKNICLKLQRSSDGLYIEELCIQLDESEGFLGLLLPVMQKNGLISKNNDRYYLEIPLFI